MISISIKDLLGKQFLQFVGHQITEKENFIFPPTDVCLSNRKQEETDVS